MCGRYCINVDGETEELQRITESLREKASLRGLHVKTGEIAPSDIVPVLANNRNMCPSFFAMRWGYLLSDGRRIINARSETAADRPLFQDGLRQRRCLVPASFYYEWEKRGKARTKYEICPVGQRQMYMAGIYRLAPSGAEFLILTREPAAEIAFIHNRMPVILSDTLADAWLDPKCPAEPILEKASLAMEFHPVP